MQAFPASQYSKIDEILVYSLFVSKKHLSYARRLKPPPVFLDDATALQTSPILSSTPSFTNQHASTLYRIYQASVSTEKIEWESTITHATQLISSAMPDIFATEDFDVLKQYATTAITSSFSSLTFPKPSFSIQYPLQLREFCWNRKGLFW
jgi:hypothetical protein